jgi:ParB family chromosome partitioning protein
LEQDLSARLGLKVQIGFDGKGGVVKLHYQSLDQLDGLLALLNRG